MKPSSAVLIPSGVCQSCIPATLKIYIHVYISEPRPHAMGACVFACLTLNGFRSDALTCAWEIYLFILALCRFMQILPLKSIKFAYLSICFLTFFSLFCFFRVCSFGRCSSFVVANVVWLQLAYFNYFTVSPVNAMNLLRISFAQAAQTQPLADKRPNGEK